MTDLEKAARQALEALEVSTDWDMNATGKQAQSMKAITVLRRALAEQPAQQEPVGMVKDLFTNAAWGKLDVLGSTKVYLNVAPQPAQRKPLTTQEIREWWASENGLEDCEMSKLDDFEKVVRAIEAAHGITSGAATLGEKK